MDTDLMKPTEVADYLKISRALTYSLLSRGQIPTVRIGKTIRVKMADLEKFILVNSRMENEPKSSGE